MTLTFDKFFEDYNNYHSFVDLLNLCREVFDYIYNEDITDSQFFQSFEEKGDGYVIIFDDKKKYIINKNSIKNNFNDEIIVDRAYEDIETLYNNIKSDFVVNIKQMDEKMKTFDEVINENVDFDYDEILDILNYGWGGTISPERFIEFEKSKYFLSRSPISKRKIIPVDNNDYADRMNGWLWDISKGKIDEKMKTFDVLINENVDFDQDEILDILRKKGWGDITPERFNEFEKTKYFKSPHNGIWPRNNKEYADRMNVWLYNISTGEIDEQFTFINEGFQDELGGKLSDKYLSLKKGILDLLDGTLKGDVTKLQSFMNTYIDPESEEIIEGFIEDADIFDFYLKYQSDIDQILLDNNYYDDPPEVESLYDYVIDGTFDAVVYCMTEMRKELYGNE